MTGYRLRAEISDTLGHFWHESLGQIYPTLKALVTAGLVEREGTAGSGPFHITPAGEARLRELLAEPFSTPPARDPLLLRLFFGRHVDPELTRERLVEALDATLSRSEEFARLRAEVEEQDPADATYWLLTLSAGEHAARARIAWAREALELLDRNAADQASRAKAQVEPQPEAAASDIADHAGVATSELRGRR